MPNLTDEQIAEIDGIMKKFAAHMAFEGRKMSVETKTSRYECMCVNLLCVVQWDEDGEEGDLVASAIGIDPNMPKDRIGALMMERGMQMMMHGGDEPGMDTLHIDTDSGEIIGENGHTHGEDCDHAG